MRSKAARTLTAEQAKAFYDWMGSRQDWQRFFEDPAVQVMLDNGDFSHATGVLEFGCGTGRLAERLMSAFVSANCRYLGIDVSPTMVGLARERMRPWQGRAEVRLSSGSCELGEADASVDRVVSCYVLDLLRADQIHRLLLESHRVLAADGLLCVVSLMQGQTTSGQLVSCVWRRLHGLSPWLVGGCRPIDPTEFLPSSLWEIKHEQVVETFGLASQVVIALPRRPVGLS